MNSKNRDRLKFSLIGLWLIFTVTFALWWFTFSLQHISTLARLEPSHIVHWQAQRRMVIWEGGTWIVLLVIGGAALIQLMRLERQRTRRIREFFASFSHEVKTSLASLRLQAETLKEDKNYGGSLILDRLVGDTVRLQLQLENSLFLASQENLRLHLQDLDLQKLVDRLREQWPGLDIQLTRPCRLQADERALQVILSNLVQNAVLHGQATAVRIVPEAHGSLVQLKVSDNGRGFEGSVQQLGQLFHRPKPTSGSGIGLYISKMLLSKMHGRLDFGNSQNGFQAQLILPGACT